MSFVCVNLYNAIHMFFYVLFCVFVSASAFFFKDKQITKQNHWAYNTERREIKKNTTSRRKLKK